MMSQTESRNDQQVEQVEDLPDQKAGAGPEPERSDAERQLEAEGDAAADYLEGLLDIIDCDGDIDIDVENGRAAVDVVEVGAGELADLVGPGGEVLDALQELSRLAAAQATGHRSRLMLDIAGFRAQRRSDLQRIATAAVAEAQAAGGPVRLDAMNAFERKVVHDAVAAVGLASHSEGEEPHRYVVVSPA
jgi:spoIIIJ-associated protein